MESQKSEFRKYCKISLEKLSKAQNKIFLDSKLQRNLLIILSQEIQHLRKKTKRPLKILLYYPLAIEFNGKKVLKTLRKQKNIEIFLPFMGDISFKIVKFRLPLHREKFGVLQPSNSYRKINLIDIAIIPVIGIDNQFKRIGFGKGMYDRFFNTQKKIPRILFICRGIFYSSLNITQYHDIKGNSLITPFVALCPKDKYDNMDVCKLRIIRTCCWRRKLPLFTKTFSG
ncbi:5-formyltetrahydrofolate cyclo-ligase [Helicobacter apodemus]|uniref:5-formyltetrahydrofolate cyclo-ligase n=1 Tax=Helicobacter apodemus TaxID=135569 RepID=A0A2U8FG44_9HELI|nr:5-formyltetrahydrofolate cyclo-ligase [Helicobacter apodemus]AWI34737.1 5-formyltetrahydrofolate cyclo-ligase [Helicobacter apodemus]